jgi:glutathione S-transferase
MTEFTLIIGNKNYSSWSLRAWLWMKHLDLNFSEKLINLYQDDTNQQLAEQHSNFKVPVLIHEDLEIWDSLAILEYLSALYPDQALLRNRQAQAVMRSLCAEMHSSFFSLRNELPMNCRREPTPLTISADCRTDINRIEAIWQYARQYSDGEADWLFGSFSMADAMFAPVVFRFDRYCIAVEPDTRQYMDRLLAHPAIIEWVNASRAEPWVLQEEER